MKHEVCVGNEKETKTGRSMDELDALCDAVDKTWGPTTTVELAREYQEEVDTAEESPIYWRVSLFYSDSARIEVTHPDRRVALGMAMSALATEGN